MADRKKIFAFGTVSICGIMAWGAQELYTSWRNSHEKSTTILHGYVFSDSSPVEHAHIRVLEENSELVKSHFEDYSRSNGEFAGNITGSGKGDVTLHVVLPDKREQSPKVVIDFSEDSVDLGIIRFSHTGVSNTPITSADAKTPDEPPSKALVTQQSGEQRAGSTAKGPSYKPVIKENEISVMVLDNDAVNYDLTNKLKSWVAANVPDRLSILQDRVLNNHAFDQCIEGDLSVLKNIQGASVSKYLCLLRCHTRFGKSGIDNDLVKAVANWELVLVNVQSGKTVFSDGDATTASGISENNAHQRTHEEIFSRLKDKKLQLQ